MGEDDETMFPTLDAVTTSSDSRRRAPMLTARHTLAASPHREARSPARVLLLVDVVGAPASSRWQASFDDVCSSWKRANAFERRGMRQPAHGLRASREARPSSTPSSTSSSSRDRSSVRRACIASVRREYCVGVWTGCPADLCGVCGSRAGRTAPCIDAAKLQQKSKHTTIKMHNMYMHMSHVHVHVHDMYM